MLHAVLHLFFSNSIHLAQCLFQKNVYKVILIIGRVLGEVNKEIEGSNRGGKGNDYVPFFFHPVLLEASFQSVWFGVSIHCSG